MPTLVLTDMHYLNNTGNITNYEMMLVKLSELKLDPEREHWKQLEELKEKHWALEKEKLILR
jgi:hypothetical protein